MAKPLRLAWNVPAFLGALRRVWRLLASPGKIFSLTDVAKHRSGYVPSYLNNLFIESGNNKAKAL